MSRRFLSALALLLAVCSSLSAAPRRRSAGTPIDETNLGPVDWLKRHGVPFETTEARTAFDDIRPFRSIVADARIVSLGEATHGSREFFTMKHRILELLVREHGFTVFAIEASLPECDRINDYVHGGDGNAGDLVRGMGFWTWNTDEVVDLVEWMREYNLSRGDRPAVSFRGFDMQFGGVALTDIAAYLAEVDPADGAAINAKYDCLRNQTMTTYRELSAAARQQCRNGIAEGLAAITARREAYAARSSSQRFDVIQRYAVVLAQMEEYWSGASVREPSMYNNAVWLLEVLHPGEKFVLWAHNGHVAAWAPSSFGDSMGVMLRRRYGAQMVVAGFLFDRGEFNARNVDLSGPVAHRIATGRDGGYEQIFRMAGRPRLFVDMRRIQSVPTREVLGGSLPAWSIGSIFADGAEYAYHTPVRLSLAYDVAIWIETVTASRLRPR